MRLTLSGLFLILSNLIPLIGVIAFGWNASAIIFLYWLESVIIGLLNVPKIVTARGGQGVGRPPETAPSRPFFTLFFILHYGIFTFVHGVFVFVMFGSGLVEDEGMMKMVPWVALSFLLSHGFSMARNYYGRKEYLTRHPMRQMFQPYGRVFVMHAVILGGGWLVDRYGGPVYALALLVILKTVIDLIAHNLEHFWSRREMKLS